MNVNHYSLHQNAGRVNVHPLIPGRKFSIIFLKNGGERGKDNRGNFYGYFFVCVGRLFDGGVGGNPVWRHGAKAGGGAAAKRACQALRSELLSGASSGTAEVFSALTPGAAAGLGAPGPAPARLCRAERRRAGGAAAGAHGAASHHGRASQGLFPAKRAAASGHPHHRLHPACRACGRTTRPSLRRCAPRWTRSCKRRWKSVWDAPLPPSPASSSRSTRALARCRRWRWAWATSSAC